MGLPFTIVVIALCLFGGAAYGISSAGVRR